MDHSAVEELSLPAPPTPPSGMRIGGLSAISYDTQIYTASFTHKTLTVANRWDEKAGLRRDAVRSQVIDVLEAQEIKETGNEKG